MAHSSSETTEKSKKKSGLKYLIYILIVLAATAISLVISLWGDNFTAVLNAFKGADWRYFLLMVGLVFSSYLIEALVIVIFCSLYRRHYKFHQGLATSLIGQFYSNVTPGASGGQAMQAYTLKSQGIEISFAASIMVMSFILYQSALILFDVFAFIFEWNVVMSITVDIPELGWHLPMWPLIVVGFLLNLSVIFLLVTMSYSHKFHNFILHYVVGFLGKIHILKNPDKTRESLRVQVENFKLELRRLASNVAVWITQIILYLAIILIRNSIPYFSAFAVHATGPYFEDGFSMLNVFHVSFLTSFHQMVTGLIPLPGSAGVSELFYTYLFSGIFLGEGVLNSSQILWRTATFHIILLVSGFVAAFYRSRPKESIQFANRKTFVDMQLTTYDERKRSADAMFETRQLSRKEIQRKIFDIPKSNLIEEDEPTMAVKPRKKPKKEKPPKPPKAKKSKADRDSDYEEWDI